MPGSNKAELCIVACNGKKIKDTIVLYAFFTDPPFRPSYVEVTLTKLLVQHTFCTHAAQNNRFITGPEGISAALLGEEESSNISAALN